MHKPADILTLERFATLPKTKLSASARAQALVHHARQSALASNQSVSDIARGNARYSFQQHQLLPQEVKAIFRDEEAAPLDTQGGDIGSPDNVGTLTKILTHQFVEDLLAEKNHSPQPQLAGTPEAQLFKQELIAFLSEYPKAGVKLYDFLQSQRHFYQDVDFHLVFKDPEVQSIFIQRVDMSCLSEIDAAYRDMYAENPDHFAMQFISSRVLTALSAGTIPEKTRGRVRKNVQLLMNYLVEQGYELEKIYMLMYKQLANWRSVASRNTTVRGKIALVHPDLFQEPSSEQADEDGLEDPVDAGMLDPRFNFDQMFKSYFMPAIIKARDSSRQLPGHPRHVDVQQKGPNYLIAPDRAMVPFREMANLALNPNPKAFSTKLRTFFTYPHDEKKLDDETLNEILAGQLRIVQSNIQSIFREGLKVRKSNNPQDPILKDFSLLAPIAECTDIRKLIIWTAYPERFAQEFPEHAKTKRTVISHQARRVLEGLILYRNTAFAPEFQDRKSNRDMLDSQIKELLSIDAQKITPAPVSYRILMEIDPVSGEPINNGHTPYVAIFPDDECWDKEKRAKDSYRLTRSERCYIAMPVESKKFYQATVHVPQPNSGPYPIDLLFYTSESHYIVNVKSGPSYFLSHLRGKKPSDIVRFMPVFSHLNSEKDREILMNFLYDFSSEVVKIDDANEGRRISKKESVTGRSQGSQTYVDHRGSSLSGYTITPVGNLMNGTTSGSDEERDAALHNRVGFEIQVMDLIALAISSSDYTATSHQEAYSPERAFRVLCDHFFPPIIYGSKFADHTLRGFRGDQKL